MPAPTRSRTGLEELTEVPQYARCTTISRIAREGYYAIVRSPDGTPCVGRNGTGSRGLVPYCRFSDVTNFELVSSRAVSWRDQLQSNGGTPMSEVVATMRDAYQREEIYLSRSHMERIMSAFRDYLS